MDTVMDRHGHRHRYGQTRIDMDMDMVDMDIVDMVDIDMDIWTWTQTRARRDTAADADTDMDTEIGIRGFILIKIIFPSLEHEALKWEVEQKQLRERHIMSKNQLKETFFLQRSQMLNRHEKVRRLMSSVQACGVAASKYLSWL